MPRLSLLLIGSLLLAAACGSGVAETAAVHRPVHIDSLVPRDEAIRRFQANTPTSDSLRGGMSTRDSLVGGFVRALARRDSVGLRRMVLDRSEFAYLDYPTNPQGLPPYDLNPDLLWFLLKSGSDKGIGRALDKWGGRPLAFAGYTCDSLPSRQGRNVMWGPCIVRFHGPDGKPERQRLFGLIVERDGRYKFESFTNRL